MLRGERGSCCAQTLVEKYYGDACNGRAVLVEEPGYEVVADE